MVLLYCKRTKGTLADPNKGYRFHNSLDVRGTKLCQMEIRDGTKTPFVSNDSR